MENIDVYYCARKNIKTICWVFLVLSIFVVFGGLIGILNAIIQTNFNDFKEFDNLGINKEDLQISIYVSSALGFIKAIIAAFVIIATANLLKYKMWARDLFIKTLIAIIVFQLLEPFISYLYVPSISTGKDFQGFFNLFMSATMVISYIWAIAVSVSMYLIIRYFNKEHTHQAILAAT